MFLSYPCTPPHLILDCSMNIACSLVGCCFNYNISTLVGISVKNVSRLQRLQSTLARVVTCQRGHISISKTLQELHWLPIKWHIYYKVATLMYKLLESGESTYVRSRIMSKIFQHSLRSTVKDSQLQPCSSQSKIRLRTFRCAALAIWNCLPYDIRAACRMTLELHHMSLSFEADSKHIISCLPFNILLWFKRSWDQLFCAPQIQFDNWFYHLACVLYKL